MKIAFWNCTLGQADNNKLSIFIKWLEWAKPDLLFLEEVSAKILTGNPIPIQEWTKLRLAGYVNTLDINGDETTKCIALLTPHGDEVNARGLRFSGNDQAKRMLLKATIKGSKITVYALHANASQSGGKSAVNAAIELLKSDENAIVGGDFNYKIKDAATEGLAGSHPFSHAGTALLFTQWNKTAYTPPAAETLPNAHLSKDRNINSTCFNFNSNVIDYIGAGKNVTVSGAKNCENEDVWWAILTHFDHCPVIYEVT